MRINKKVLVYGYVCVISYEELLIVYWFYGWLIWFEVSVTAPEGGNR